VRLIQGAQEVQHVFTIAGRSWRRQPASGDSALVSSQEIGISEHFEMDFSLPFNARFGKDSSIDYLYTAGTVDALWNGAWGLFRSYGTPSANDPSRPANAGGAFEMRCRIAVLGAPGSAAVNAADAAGCRGLQPATDAANADRYAAIPASLAPGSIKGLGSTTTVRPDKVVNARLFCVEAIAGPITYNARDGITDPNAARYRLVNQYAFTLDPESWSQPRCGDAAGRYTALPVAADDTKPLVLRMRSGEFGFAEVVNRIGTPGRTSDNAVLPPIVSKSSDPQSYSDHTTNDRLTPSRFVGLTPQLVSLDIKQNAGIRAGLNIVPVNLADGAPPLESQKKDGGTATLSWYAGRTVFKNKNGRRSIKFKPFDVKEGLVSPLSSMADPIRHPVMGLVGALVIEPETAEIANERDGGTMATICTGKGSKRKCFEEAVLVYQDGLNLKKRGVSIPDCHVCDDTYDSGDIAFNYRTEPLWSRLGLPVQDRAPNDTSGRPQLVDLSNYAIPACTLLPAFKPIETPIFKAQPGARMIVRLAHPGGRARQRAFVTYGHRYDDLGMAGFGSPSSTLLAPQRSASADLGALREGLWLYRDGPGQFFGGGAWGYIDTRTAPVNTCPAP
jgi:manganese oxidase